MGIRIVGRQSVVKRRVYMEGGDSKSAAKRANQRLGAQDLFNKVTVDGAKFEVRLGTNTDRTLKNFTGDRSQGHVLLLVDSDGNVDGEPIAHLRSQGKSLPDGVDVADIHLMIHTMETWMVADPVGLRKTFPLLKVDKLRTNDLEGRDRQHIGRALKLAIGEPYDKIVGLAALRHLDPIAIETRCPSAKRFFDRLRNAE